MKKALAVILSIIILFGWFVTLEGLGPVKPIKDQMKLGLDLKGGVYVVMEAQTNATGEELKSLMSQTQAVIEKRVNQLGLSEPVVTIEGQNRIRVELPGAKNATDAINAIGKTAQLQFVRADDKVVLDGSNVKDAGIEQDKENGGYAIGLKFDATGAEAFKTATEDIVAGKVKSTHSDLPDNTILIVLDGQVISNPLVHEVIPNGQAIITGGSEASAKTKRPTCQL